LVQQIGRFSGAAFGLTLYSIMLALIFAAVATAYLGASVGAVLILPAFLGILIFTGIAGLRKK